MKLTISQLLQEGIDFLNKVNFKKAENCYQAILELQPQQFIMVKKIELWLELIFIVFKEFI